jgi:methionyl-tRNA synthetase
VNGDLHPGHLAGYLLPADIFARFNRLLGNDVLMVSGSDCHGTPITLEAEKRNVSPSVIVDTYHKKNMDLFTYFNLEYNLYTKTTTINHQEVVQKLFLDLLRNGYIFKKTTVQYFSSSENRFLPDRYVQGQCSYCKAIDQRSDQCESCGKWLDVGDLIDPYSKLTGDALSLVDTEHYFLDLKKLQNRLIPYVEEKKDIWKDWVYKESVSWLDKGLEPRSITRDLDWGVEIPTEIIESNFDIDLIKDSESKRFYVWFEAVVGYLSASVEWSQNSCDKSVPKECLFLRTEGQSENWEDWWLNKYAEQYYFLGQDNLIFHCLLWPAQLMGTGRGYQLPYNVVVNKFMQYEGGKFSKSKGNTVDMRALGEEYGVDAVRFYISTVLPQNKESNFDRKILESTINDRLIANIGNLVFRVLKFQSNNFDKKLSKDFSSINYDVIKEVENCYQKTESLLSKCKFTESLVEIEKLGDFANKYFNDTEIWKLIKEDPKKAESLMIDFLIIINNIATLLYPYMPESSLKIKSYLNTKEDIYYSVGENKWEPNWRTHFDILEKIKEPLFKKIVD